MSDKPQDRERQMQRFAYDKVNAWSGAWRPGAVQLAQGLPVTLRAQGLLLTVATLMGKGKGEHAALAQLLADWVLREQGARSPGPAGTKREAPSPRNLLDVCAKADRAAYQAMQWEAIAVMDQVKVLAKALYGAEADHG
jgi:hypothetical protein